MCTASVRIILALYYVSTNSFSASKMMSYIHYSRPVSAQGRTDDGLCKFSAINSLQDQCLKDGANPNSLVASITKVCRARYSNREPDGRWQTSRRAVQESMLMCTIMGVACLSITVSQAVCWQLKWSECAITIESLVSCRYSKRMPSK